MKKIFFVVALLSAMHSFAQKDGGVILKQGQIITATTTSTTDMDMGMGQMKNDMSATNVLNVISADKNYRISNTLTKLNLSVNAMGQQTKYNSEKPEDKDSEIGKELSKSVNHPDTFFVEKTSGDVTTKTDGPERPQKSDDINPLAGMMGGAASFGSVDGATLLKSAFFVIPKGKKTGDSWTDSSTMKTMKSVRTYTIKSIDKNTATITVTGTITGSGDTEMQGSTVSFTMDTKNKGEMTVDIKNGLVNKSSTDADITMNMEVMGQSLPLNSKTNYTVTYQY